jgi:hypothetical protein
MRRAFWLPFSLLPRGGVIWWSLCRFVFHFGSLLVDFGSILAPFWMLWAHNWFIPVFMKTLVRKGGFRHQFAILFRHRYAMPFWMVCFPFLTQSASRNWLRICNCIDLSVCFDGMFMVLTLPQLRLRQCLQIALASPKRPPLAASTDSRFYTKTNDWTDTGRAFDHLRSHVATILSCPMYAIAPWARSELNKHDQSKATAQSTKVSSKRPTKTTCCCWAQVHAGGNPTYYCRRVVSRAMVPFKPRWGEDWWPTLQIRCRYSAYVFYPLERARSSRAVEEHTVRWKPRSKFGIVVHALL